MICSALRLSRRGKAAHCRAMWSSSSASRMARWLFSDPCKSFLDGLLDGLGQRFSGQTRQPFCQGMRVRVFDIQGHRKILHGSVCGGMKEKSTGRLTQRKLRLAARHLHLYRDSASANIAFNCSRKLAASASAAFSLASSSSGSPWSSSDVCGFLMSRL